MPAQAADRSLPLNAMPTKREARRPLDPTEKGEIPAPSGGDPALARLLESQAEVFRGATPRWLVPEGRSPRKRAAQQPVEPAPLRWSKRPRGERRIRSCPSPGAASP